MLTIRLTRKGKKNQPFFRVVVIDKRRSSKGGRAVEDLGYVDPLKKRRNFKKERIQYWLAKGAQPSPTVHNFLVSEKIIDAKKINVSKKSKKAPKQSETAVTPSAGSSSGAQEAVPPATAAAPVTPEVKPAETPKDLPVQPEAKPAEPSPAPETPKT